MTNSRSLITGIIKKAVLVAVSVICAVALPQIFHFIGSASGVGSRVGEALLPMHIPVLLAGFLFGPAVGAISGFLSPVVSFVLTGMPASVVLPFIMVELTVYGLVSGLLSKTKLNNFVSLVITQFSGRIIRALAFVLFANVPLSVTTVFSFVTVGLFGIIIQWAVVPAVVKNLKGIKKLYE